MKVSVITPVYNSSKTIKKTLESILNQTHKDLEVLVVDDGSTDNSAEIIKSISDPRIRYFKIKNSGSPSRPRNVAIESATGDFIALCDSDDIWYKDKLNKQLDAYKNAQTPSRVGIIACSADMIDESDKIIESNMLEDKYILATEARNALLQSDFITACSALVPLSVAEEIGGINESLKGVDEYDYWLRITKKYDVITVSDILCAWRQTGANMSNDKTSLYLQAEKIFDQIEKEENSDAVKAGHTKNLNRVLAAALIANDRVTVDEVIKKLKFREINWKTKLIIMLSEINQSLARVCILALKKINIVNI